MQVLASLQSVAYVIPFHEDTPIHLIQSIKPDFLVKGADYHISKIVGAEFVASYGGKVTTIDLEPGLSTSKIIEQLDNH